MHICLSLTVNEMNSLSFISISSKTEFFVLIKLLAQAYGKVIHDEMILGGGGKVGGGMKRCEAVGRVLVDIWIYRCEGGG